MPDRTPQTDTYFAAFRHHHGDVPDRYDVAMLGDSPALVDELVDLVLRGRKRATASLIRDYAGPDVGMPQVGDLVVAVDFAGHPRLIWQTVELRVGPLLSCDAQFAYDEGEGDRSLTYWLNAHRDFFGRQARHEGWQLTEAEPVLFERFRVVWPLDVADAGCPDT